MSCCSKAPKTAISIKPYEERSCTDVLFLILFIAFWGFTIYLASYSIGQGGNPNRMIRGVDMYGRICGVDSGVKDQPYAAWPLPTYYDAQICVTSCAETQTNSNMVIQTPSTKFLYFCIPSVTLSGDFSSSTQQLSRAIGDLYIAWPVLLGSAFGAVLVAWCYIFFCKRFAGTLVWTCIFGVAVGGAFMGWSFLAAAKQANSDIDSTRVKAMYGVGGALLGFTVIFVLIVIALRNRIRIAVEVVKEASKALADMPLMTVFPGIPFLFACGYFAFWVVVALYLYTVADRATKDTPSALTMTTSLPSTQTYYERKTSLNNAIAAHFFGLLWNVQFLIYFCYLALAGAVADWYFQPFGSPLRASRSTRVMPVVGSEAWSEGGGNKQIAIKPPPAQGTSTAKAPVWSSVKRTLRFHLGTIALGALILAIVNMVRATVAYIAAKSKNRKNPLQKAVFCIVQCLLKCLHCCLDKLSKNAFIWTAIWGDSFAPAACGSFKLLFKNLARVAAINMVGAYLLFVGKLLVSLLTTGVCAVILMSNSYYSEHLSSPLLPSLVVFIISYATASLFLNVYEVCIDTIFLCFLVDSEYNKDAPMMFASKGLQELVGRHAVESKKLADTAAGKAEGGDVEKGNAETGQHF